MVYPENFEDKVGFNVVRKKLSAYCFSALGREYVDKMRFITNFNALELRFAQLKELISIIQQAENLPLAHFLDSKEFIHKAGIDGSFLTEEEFTHLLAALHTVAAMLTFFAERKEHYPALFQLCEQVKLDSNLLKKLSAYFNKEGRLHDHASPELKHIRSELKKLEGRLRKVIDGIYKEAKAKGYIPDGQSVTIRDGRLVVPVLAEHKRRIKGYVQDESATGQMIYLEPAESIEINNELRALKYQEKREVVKVLEMLTSLIRPDIYAFEKAVNFMAQMDFIQAKAKLALHTHAQIPQLHHKPILRWNNARNTHLLFAFEGTEKKVVPLSIALDIQKRILIISGPNAGGKSVALKTVGLLQYMFQCGLAVTADADSTFGLFQQVMIDIGDEQSIENDLSTYSSHLQNMRSFIQRANKKTLFLIDEFGTGTEPQIGGAMAEAVLDELYQFGSFGVITTHYENIKHYAASHHEVLNGAMRFDQEQLKPLYELEIGKPGSSFALELAQKMGLPEKVLEKARKRTGTAKVDYEKLLSKLENDHQYIEKTKGQLAQKEEELKTLAADYQGLKNYLTEQKNAILKTAKQEAKSILDEANKKVEATIRIIKEAQADKEKTKAARAELQASKKALSDSKKENKQASYQVEKGSNIQVGDSVLLDDSDAIGEVLALKGKEAHISLGGLTTFVKMKRLTKVSKAQHRKAVRSNVNSASRKINEEMAHFRAEIDLRGQRAEEAVGAVDRLLDQAMMLNQKSVRIIHGKGNGILRQIIRDYIKQYDFVQSFENEHVERGGDGITIVHLRD